MEGGNALARTLFGAVNPSGKLTTTWCKRLEDMPDHVFGEYPGINDTVRFKEGLMVGYRYFDTYLNSVMDYPIPLLLIQT